MFSLNFRSGKIFLKLFDLKNRTLKVLVKPTHVTFSNEIWRSSLFEFSLAFFREVSAKKSLSKNFGQPAVPRRVFISLGVLIWLGWPQNRTVYFEWPAESFTGPKNRQGLCSLQNLSKILTWTLFPRSWPAGVKRSAKL